MQITAALKGVELIWKILRVALRSMITLGISNLHLSFHSVTSRNIKHTFKVITGSSHVFVLWHCIRLFTHCGDC
jgi:hypothetical protein